VLSPPGVLINEVAMVSKSRCPICEKSVTQPASAAEKSPFPFCSVRCQQVDLMRWMDGKYAIVEPVDDLEDPALADVPRVFERDPGDE
jgi:uncharacterized protein